MTPSRIGHVWKTCKLAPRRVENATLSTVPDFVVKAEGVTAAYVATLRIMVRQIDRIGFTMYYLILSAFHIRMNQSHFLSTYEREETMPNAEPFAKTQTV